MDFKTTIRLTHEFNEELRVTMARRRVKSLQQALDEALELWMSGPRTAGSGTVPAGLEDVAHFFKHGDPLLVKVVRDIVAAHHQIKKAKS